MKKQFSKTKADSRRKPARKSASASAKPGHRTAARHVASRSTRSTPQATRLAPNAQEIYGRAHQLQRDADHLHHSIEHLHHAADELHHPKPGVDLETASIVREEKPRRPSKPFPIVGIGASAGGYEAFSDFLKHLADDTGMAFVLVQHLDPNHKSQLSGLLGHNSKIPVVEASNDLEIQPNRIYVIPEN